MSEFTHGNCNKPGPLKLLEYATDSFQTFITFSGPKNTLNDTHKTRKSHFPQLETKILFFSKNIFRKSLNLSKKELSAQIPSSSKAYESGRVPSDQMKVSKKTHSSNKI